MSRKPTAAQIAETASMNPFTDNGRLDYRPRVKVDQVNHPPHYTQVPGLEAIQVTQHFNFNLGNAIKYIWRCDHKGNPIEDLEKAIFYIKTEIDRRKEGK